ncbi:MAG: hypothetical protein AAB648_01180 [Patescibacteria group bacterium]
MKSLPEVIQEVERERENQYKKWEDPGPNFEEYEKRPFEEWLILTSLYAQEALSEYGHKPGNAAAREKLLKVANLALWGLQSNSLTTY